MVSRVPQQGAVVGVEEHLLGAGLVRLAGGGAEKQDMAVRVTGGDVEAVRRPLGVVDSPVALAWSLLS